MAERGRVPSVLRAGNLAPRRDLTDVRDTVRAYVALVEHGRPGTRLQRLLRPRARDAGAGGRPEGNGDRAGLDRD